MKQLTQVIDIFDFCEAAGYYVQVWPTAKGVIVLFPSLPWWAWIRRKSMDQTIERLRKAVPVTWSLTCTEAVQRDMDDYFNGNVAGRAAEEEVEAKRIEIDGYRAAGQKELHRVMAERLQRDSQRPYSVNLPDHFDVFGSRVDRVDSTTFFAQERAAMETANQQELFDAPEVITATSSITEGLSPREWRFEDPTPCRQESSQADTCSDTTQDTSSESTYEN